VRILDEGQPIPRTSITPALLPASICLRRMGLGCLAGWVFLCPLPMLLCRQGRGTWDSPTDDKMTFNFMT
jgi:hypothetical protein